MANSLINVVGTNIQQAAFTANEYVSSGTFVYVSIGHVVAFYAEYTPATDIVNSAVISFSRLPPVTGGKGFKFPDWDINTSSDFADNSRCFYISNKVYMIGAHTTGVTYRACGLYFTN